MILLLSTFITNKRPSNRYSRLDVFKYTLYSYRLLPFTHIYLYILLDNEFIQFREDLNNYIHDIFKGKKINIEFNRYTSQELWTPIIENLVNVHGEDELVWFTQNDDHVFIDFNLDVLNEGLELLKNDSSTHKSIYFSHWPEIIRMSGKYSEPILIGNYVKFNLSLLDSIQIFNLKFLYNVMVLYKWKSDHLRIDSILNELTCRPAEEDPLNQKIFVPLRELVRHFDGYGHVAMDETACPRLLLPKNTFSYSKEILCKKMYAYHSSCWTNGNNFKPPIQWLDINISLHPSNMISFTL